MSQELLPLQRNTTSLKTISHIFTRIRNLIFFPANEWKDIAAENSNRKTVYIRYVLPVLCLIAIATIIGTWLATPRDIYSVGFVIYWIILLWTSLSVGLYFSAFVITEIMVHQLGARDHKRAFVLIAYASCAAYLVIALVSLFPFFRELLVLAFYSCYLYWKGIPYLLGIDGQKRMIYALLSFIIVILAYVLVFFFFGKVLRAVLM